MSLDQDKLSESKSRRSKSTSSRRQKLHSEFSYRGLLFKIYQSDFGFTIKQGRRIVSRQFTVPANHEEKIKKAIESIKQGVDRGYGLNIDYDKVESFNRKKWDERYMDEDFVEDEESKARQNWNLRYIDDDDFEDD